ncbi:unnamed protein product, partial [Rhizoctonia solani]
HARRVPYWANGNVTKCRTRPPPTMTNSGWYPPGQVCYPPELPAHLKDVPELKPIKGVPSDDEVIKVHAVINVANRIVGIPGLHDPTFFMKLADHLFNIQMARYRSRYSLVTFPSDAVYTPPALPAHITIDLEPVSGAPSDDQLTKVQDAIQTYQEFKRVPSMFDARINMELSQHLFDLQMARHMRMASEIQSSPISEATTEPESLAQTTGHPPSPQISSNNKGSGEDTGAAPRASQPASDTDVHESTDQSNPSSGQSSQPVNQPCSHVLAERFNQVLERLVQIVGQSSQQAERSHQFAERFNQLFERLDQLLEQSSQPAHRANELAERSNELAERLNQLSERSNTLTEQVNKPVQKLGDILQNINRVLVGIQHAIVRNHKGNKVDAINCLVNEKGELPGLMHTAHRSTVGVFGSRSSSGICPVIIDGISQNYYIPDCWVGDFLRFYGICGELLQGTVTVRTGKEAEARERLGDYLASCLG